MNAKIASIAFGGSGIARCENKVYFIPFTIPGEVVSFQPKKEKKSYAEGTLTQIDIPSEQRREPPCRHFTRCGGCVFQHMNYKQQCAAKKQIVLDALQRIGKLPVDTISFHAAPQEWAYRKHIRVNLRKKKTGFTAGYIGLNNKELIELKECPISPFTGTFFKTLQEQLLTLDNTQIESGSLRIFDTPNGALLAFSFAPQFPKNWQEWGDATIPFATAITYKAPRKNARFGSVPEGINPYGFTQCNQAVAGMLYAHILSLTTTANRILDLYGGSGELSCLLAKNGKEVILVEQNRSSCIEAQKKAKNEGISLKIFSQSVESFQFTQAYDTALINPPREGLSQPVLDLLIQAKIPQLIYTSCMPSTLARDLAHLCNNGYSLKCIDAFDMFPQTTHIETVVLLSLNARHN